MAETIGRQMTIALGTGASPVTITGVRTKSVSINNEVIDITNDDDAGWRDLLAVPGTKSIDIEVEGVWVDSDVRDAILSASDISDTVTITWETGQTLSGTGILANYAETGAHNDAKTYTLTIQSAGAFS